MADYRPCAECNRPTRPNRTTAAAHPGTVPRVGKHCHNCRRKIKAAAAVERHDQQRPAARPTTAENRANLRSWLISRGYAGTSV